MTKQIIIYSHGFGVEKDDRGLFTSLSMYMSNIEHIMFNYNQVDRDKNELTATPLDLQAQKLREVVDREHINNPDASINIVAHSQGCLVAALAKPNGVRKTIFTAPPQDADIESKVKRWRTKYGSHFTTTGTSYLERKDGSTTIVPAEYWTSMKGLDAHELYNELAKITELTIVTATEDEVLGEVILNDLSSDIKLVEMATGHNFEGESRIKLAEIITTILGTNE